MEHIGQAFALLYLILLVAVFIYASIPSKCKKCGSKNLTDVGYEGKKQKCDDCGSEN